MKKYPVFIICIFLIVVFLGIATADNITPPPPPEPNAAELFSQLLESLSYSVTMEVGVPKDLIEGEFGRPVNYYFPIKLSVENTSFTGCFITINREDKKTVKLEKILFEQSIGAENTKNLRKYGKVEFTEPVPFPSEGKYQVIFDVDCSYGKIERDDHDTKDVTIISEIAYLELKTAIENNKILEKSNKALIIITLASVIISPLISEFLSRKSMNKINKNLNKIASSILILKKKPK